MALSTCSGFLQVLFNWAVGQNMPASSLNLPASGNSSTQGKKVNYKTGTNVAGGANEAFFFFVTIAPSGTATIDLTNLTDVAQFTGISLARVKALYLQLLSKADDKTNGTPASSVTIGGAPANPFQPFGLSAGATFALNNGQPIGSGDPSAAGQVVSGTAKNLQIVNNDAVNSAAVLIAGFGATS